MITYSSDDTANYSIDTVATYSCVEGYFLEMNDTERTCKDDEDGIDDIGEWSGEEPHCVRELILYS